MSSAEINNRIARNTIALYFRQAITMIVALYTSRIVLRTLGADDYGINDAVISIIAMTSLLTGIMSASAQRFFSYAIGENNPDKLNKYFRTMMEIQFLLGLATLLMAETIGLWYLNTRLVFPDTRMYAANWVYQFSAASAFMSIMLTPYTAMVISHEDMHVFGYMSIFDVVMRLFTVYMLLFFDFDKLILLSMLGFVVSILNLVIYYLYCKKKYTACWFKFYWNKELFSELLSFSGWRCLSVVGMLNNYGFNLVINSFYGPVLNAARGLGGSVCMAVNSLYTNYTSASTPQIVKYHSTHATEDMWLLLVRMIKLGYFLLFLFCLPLLLETEYVLILWLGNFPEYTVIFTQLAVIDMLQAAALWGFTNTITFASGKIKMLQLAMAFMTITAFLGSIGIGYLGYQPQYMIIFRLTYSILLFPFCLYLVKRQHDFSLRYYFKDILRPILLVTFSSTLLTYPVAYYLPASIVNSIFVMFFGAAIAATASFFIGMNKNEREFVRTYLKKFISTLKHNKETRR